jgi:hypothetical protein
LTSLPARPVHAPSASAGPAIPLALPVALAATCGLFFNGFDNAAGQATGAIVAAAALALCLVSIPAPASAWRTTLPVIVPALLAFAWLVLAGSFGAERAAPDLELAGWLGWLAGFGMLLAGWQIGRQADRKDEAIGWIVLFGTLYMLLGLLIQMQGQAGAFGYWTVIRDGRFQGLAGNVNVTATAAGVVVLLALSRLLACSGWPAGRRDRLTFAGWTLAAVATGAAAIATASRLPIVALVVIATALIAGRAARGHERPGAVAAGVGLIALLILIGLGSFVERLHARFDLVGDSLALRAAMWRHYAAVAADAPWTGFGANGFAAAATHVPSEPEFQWATWMVNSAHNLVLQLLIAGGLPYLLLLTAAGVAWLRTVGRWLHAAGSLRDLGLAAALALVAAVALIDIPLDLTAGAMLTLFLAGLLWGHATDAPPRDPKQAPA